MQGVSATPATPSASVPLDPNQQLHVTANISELPVPPTVPPDGLCTNPTGCVSAAWGGLGSPGFFWDPHYVLVGVTFAGAPAAPAPASIYSGNQVLLVSTDGTKFPDGDGWKCITCGVAVGSDVLTTFYNYPPPDGLADGHRVLVGNGILDCGPYLVSDPRCTANNTHIYPIYLGSQPLGASSGFTTNGREWRLSPDGVHLAWDVLIINGSAIEEFPFVGRLAFDATNHRYNLVNISLLPQTSPYTVEQGNQLEFDPREMIGELRGWSSDGKSILGIQSYESDSIDAWATSLATGGSTPLTDHAEYTDPMNMSPNGRWLIADEVRGSGRLDFISGMEGIPPLTDQLSTTGFVSGIRNNGQRRFFLPWLVSLDKSASEQINAGSDPNWNAAADPVWLADSTGVVWAENLACGANSPTPCSSSSEPGGRNSRIMMARFPNLTPSDPTAPAPISDTIPWGIPYTPGQPFPSLPAPLATGTYTLQGTIRGEATAVITDNSASTAINGIAVTYHDFSDRPGYFINGTESVASNGTTSPFAEKVTWIEDLTLSGRHTGTKITSPGGFTLGPSVLLSNNFQPTGTMTTTIDGITYTQPANGA
jgi:hypothetical protein